MDGAQKEGSPAAGRRRSGPGEVRQGAELHGAAGRQGLVQASALPASVRYVGRQDYGVYLAGLVLRRRRRSWDLIRLASIRSFRTTRPGMLPWRSAQDPPPSDRLSPEVGARRQRPRSLRPRVIASLLRAADLRLARRVRGPVPSPSPAIDHRPFAPLRPPALSGHRSTAGARP